MLRLISRTVKQILYKKKYAGFKKKAVGNFLQSLSFNNIFYERLGNFVNASVLKITWYLFLFKMFKNNSIFDRHTLTNKEYCTFYRSPGDHM